MGRFKSKRKQLMHLTEDFTSVFIQLAQWLKKQGCTLPDNIQWAHFGDTGRGLCTTTYIEKDSLLITLPKSTMITLHTAMQSHVGNWFLDADQTQMFSDQQVLATFVVWEKHLGPDSKWDPYIMSLPAEYTTPLTLSKREKALLPKHIRGIVREQEEAVSNSFKQLINIIGSNSMCEHCGKYLLTDIFSFKSFLWAWNVVNTRSVYVKPTATDIRLKGENTQALAPFLDLFNHSCSTTSTVEETTHSYSLFSSDAWATNNQVFISYGPHANYKLYAEYGFVVDNNPHDIIPISVQEIDQVTTSFDNVSKWTFSKARHELILQHKLSENLYFSNEGPSFTLQMYVYVREICEFDRKGLQQKIFSCKFSDDEKEVINKVVTKLLCSKIVEYQQQFETMLQLSSCTESFVIARSLVKYHLQLLESVYEHFFD